MPGKPGGGYFPGSPDEWVATRESDLSHLLLDPVSELSRGDHLAELLSGDGGNRWQVVSRQVTVGSGEGVDLRISGAGMAPRHFGLRLDEGIWRLHGLGDAVLEVDGCVVTSEVVIAPGSEIRTGGVTLFFAPMDRWEDSSAAAGALASGHLASDAEVDAGGHPGYVLDVPGSSDGPSTMLLVIGGLLIIAAVVFLLLRAG